MFFRKKEPPSQNKTEIALSRCQENIQAALNRYELQRINYVKKMAKLKREGRETELSYTKETLRVILTQQAKMNHFFNQFLKVRFLIEEAFVKNQIYSSLGNVLSVAKHISASSEFNKMLKDLVKFEKSFTKASKEFSSIMNIVDKSMNGVANSDIDVDDEIKQMVDDELQRSEEEAIYQANNSDLFKLD